MWYHAFILFVITAIYIFIFPNKNMDRHFIYTLFFYLLIFIGFFREAGSIYILPRPEPSETINGSFNK
jgi:hypothetical protein